MRSKIHFFFVSLILTGLITSSVFGQLEDPRKWSTEIQPTGEFFEVPLSHIKYVHPNITPTVFETVLGSATVEPNQRVYPSVFTQSEVPIQRHPTDPNILFASSNSVRISPFFISEGVYVTTDGGITWFGSDTTKSNPITNHGGDPAPAIDANGRFYNSYLGDFNVIPGIWASYSDDMGATWSNQAQIIGGSQDKNHTVVDNRPSSPFFGRVYVSWSRFNTGSPPIAISYSTDSGVSWSTPQDINTPPGGHYSQGVNGAIGPNGEVYMVWQNPISGSPFTGDVMGFAKSLDGGVTWSVNNTIYDCNGIRGFLLSTVIRVNDFPWMGVDTTNGSRQGWIYVVHAEKNLAPAGSDPDIILHRSTDGGTTWSSGIRVNQDALNNGASQYMPAIIVGDDGSVNVVYYDTRFLSNDSATVYIARSLDGGNTWTEVEVSDHHFKPKPISGLAGGYQGDYIGITEANGILYPYWADDVTGIYQAWLTRVTFGPPCPVDPPSNPNPVNGATDVSINLAQLSWNNGVGATNIEVWFDGNLVYSGVPITSWAIDPSPLNYSTSYTWRIAGMNDTCSVFGPTWSFTTEEDPSIIKLFADDFEGTLDEWSITNDGGTCVWAQYFAPYPNSYTLPPSSSGGVFSADSDECGSGTTLLSTATMVNPVDVSLYQAVRLEWDNDWRTIDAADEAHVEISVDGGGTWNPVVSWIGVDQRNTHEIWDVSGIAALQSSVLFRFRSIQPGWDWWWTIDNVSIYVSDIVPVELTSFTVNVDKDNVNLSWSTATETNNQGFEIQRSSGDNDFESVGYVPGFGTTTETQSYSFTDSKVEEGNYSYRLKQIDFNGTFDYSDEVTIDVSVPLEFALEQNYPNPFNPSTVIKYSIPEDGFVTVDVYNLLGENVASLVNVIQKAGRYEINFNASNLASGFYVYTLKSGNFNSVKKMLLMK